MGSEWLQTVALFISWANGRLSTWQSGGCDLEDPNDSDPDPTLVYVSPLGAPVSVSVYRAAIHATLGPFEDLEHVFHLRAKGGVTQDTTTAGLQAMAARIGAAWTAFFKTDTAAYGTLSSGTATDHFFSPVLAYDKIVMSYLTYPGGWLDEGAKKVNPPITVTPSTVWSFPASVPGTDTTNPALPTEVALCLTLLTDQTGKRTRGRVYLGGLTTRLLEAPAQPANVQGFFNGLGNAIGHRFGADFVDGLHTDAACTAELNIVSRIGGGSRGVGGVKQGLVPDSQRRRRWHMPENPTLVWGAA